MGRKIFLLIMRMSSHPYLHIYATINFDVVSAKAEYLGGVICPGIGMSISGLFARTARLPMVDFREPEKLIGSNTVGSIQSGLYYGKLRGIYHDRDLRNIRFTLDKIQKICHGLHSIQQGIIHIYIQHLCAILYLLPGHT